MFVHLRVHSYYSFCRGADRIESLVDAALAHGMRAMALTDINGVYGLVRFLQYAAERGLRSVVGADVRTAAERATLLARNRDGYATLCRFISRMRLETGFSLSEALREEREHLIVISDCMPLLSALGKRNGTSRLYVELNDPCAEPRLLAFSRKTGIPPVATNDVYFADPSGFSLHRLLRAIDLNTSLSRIPPGELAGEDRWLKPETMMARRYPHLDRALETTAAIAEACFTGPDIGTPVFPSPDLPDGTDAFEYLRQECYHGAEERYGELPDSVLKRLEHELAIIKAKGFVNYFLVVRDIVRQSARTCGRGSAAASLVAYCLGITHVEPIAHNLFFERFLNERRSDPPDIDIDFPWDERDRIFDYVFRRYGVERAAMVSNHVGFQARAAIREVARVYGLPEQEISAVTRRMGYYWRLGRLEDAVRQHPVYKDMEFRDPWPEIIRLAMKMDGYPRHMSVHCGGIVIVSDRIDRYVPVETAPKGAPIIQWEKDQAEDAGLIKIDILGNRSLAVIRDAISSVRENYGVTIDYERWDPTKDRKTCELMRAGDTVGVFYVESPAMRQLQKKCMTGDFDHLVIHSSIIRPAANRHVREYVRRLRGGFRQSLHPILDDVLRETYGIMVYQEDVSRIAMALAGFDASDADMLRKILSKKRAGGKLEDYRERFRAGATGRGVTPEVIDEVWEMIMSFSGYSFCKPHSASYALVSYKSCYLRAHYPAEFMAAVLTNRGGYYAAFAYVSEARRMGLRVLMPDVNESGKAFRGKDRTIRVGLMQLKGLRESALEAILTAREQGPFVSFDDFLNRAAIDMADLRIVIRSGAADSIAGGSTRPELLWKALAWREHRPRREKRAGVRPAMRSLFEEAPPVVPPPAPPYGGRAVVEHELETLGFLLSRHPLSLYARQLSRLNYVRGVDFPRYAGKGITAVGWWVTGKTVMAKNDEPMEFISFEDTSALYETVFFPREYRRFCHLLNRSRPYVLTGMVREDFGAVTLEVDSVRLL
ncbi:MAG TPA: DNA polymerase III subunit alpha [Acidobacteriota bacterium]|nr:DNA polymerase III subunit alpha [Acidobacteriota bacterium]